MSKKTVTRAHIYDAVYREVGLSRNESIELVERVFSEITDSLVNGESVKLSTFGSFKVRSKRKRMGRNPKTGASAIISPRRVVSFKASPILTKKVHLNLRKKKK